MIIPFKDTKILEFNQHSKSDKTSSIFMQILGLIKKVDEFKNPEKWSTRFSLQVFNVNNVNSWWYEK